MMYVLRWIRKLFIEHEMCYFVREVDKKRVSALDYRKRRRGIVLHDTSFLLRESLAQAKPVRVSLNISLNLGMSCLPGAEMPFSLALMARDQNGDELCDSHARPRASGYSSDRKSSAALILVSVSYPDRLYILVGIWGS